MSGYNVPEAKTVICQSQNAANGAVTAGAPFPLTPTTQTPDCFYYGVRVVTGSEQNAGTTNCLFIQLIGNKASTGSVTISNSIINSPVANTACYDEFLLECSKDLGEVLVIVLGTSQKWLGGSSWFVDYVYCIDFQTKHWKEFPCYHWISEGDCVSCTSDTTTGKDIEGNAILQHQRQTQMDQRRILYKWQVFPDLKLPSAIDVTVKQLPTDEQFDCVKSLDFTVGTYGAVATISLKALFTTIDSLRQYEELANAIEKPKFAVYELGRWVRDEEFGRQILNGVNPVIIERCSSIPTNFPVTTDMVKGSLSRGLSLEDEMKGGHVYICDLKILDGISCKEGWSCPAPMCLLYVNGHNQLVPIAIQLKQQPGEDNPIFLPTDNWADWMLAKICYQSANTQFHQIATHYLSCHAAMETYGVAVMRNLPDTHPVHKLLRPHFRYTMAINARARKTLINDGGVIDQIFALGGDGKKELMRRGGASFNVHWTNIEHSVKVRGVDDPNLLPGYFYRDDGLKIWQAIKNFVTDIIKEFYTRDADVKGDSELQSWANDVHTNGFPAHEGGIQGHGFPKEIANRSKLIELCTLIMFTGSAQHAAINFGQYEIYSYAPNAPSGVRGSLPTTKGKADMQSVMDALPDKTVTSKAAAITNALSQFSRNEHFLGNFPYEIFTEEKARNMIKRFQKALQGIEGDIEQRNKSLDVPYVYLVPKLVPNSITI